ncbi:alcohol dehydrogenase catalytic domain-containing protein [Enterococcus sp. 669A]|uniref:Alcohol dehydrogenase catalytic domain-containing protein n=1 Tax=Candidatus Enterococcus moelleringii TaxID=2815325 RepID=A0ABS3LH21_9ENTE|nr:alcohol dehydrogenase catalytic domain-containing protein [Enterococcus sp. 669A]MBO1307654.1 alcohol dehydrogenase catalytic domain-containing protein [Enterococcus sp. 669A]
MKSFVMDENRDLVVKEMEQPVLGKDDMIVKIKTASICGTDMRTFLKGSPKIDPPRILGHEFSAEVCEVSPYAEELGFKVGDRVTAAPAIGCGECWSCKTGHTNMCDDLKTLGFQYEGSFAEYMAIPNQALKMGNVIKLPDTIEDDDATLIEPAACALNAQSYLNISADEYVVIYGSGLIGCIHAELAMIQGAKQVIMIEPIESRGRVAEKMVPGVKWLSSNTENMAEEITKLTEGRGADVVITATSYAPVHTEAQVIAAKRGRISLFGGIAGDGKGYLDSNLIHYKELQIFGVHATTVDFMNEIKEYILAGKLDLKKYIEKEVVIDDILEGFESIRDEGTMKVVIHF